MKRETKDPVPSHVPGGEHADMPSRQGTHIMPMPKVPDQVAGMPRDGRALTEPGDPGVPAGEDDFLDTSKSKPPGQID